MNTIHPKTGRIFRLTLRLLFLLVILGAFFAARPAAASDKDVDLTLACHGDSLTGSSGSQGHAFLIIKNNTSEKLNFCNYPINPGTEISVSIWPDSMGDGGVFINREMADGPVSCRACTIGITRAQFASLAATTPAESYYHDGANDTLMDLSDDLWHNCTTYSVKMWNLVADSDHQIKESFLGIDAPKWLGEKLAKFSDSYILAYAGRYTESSNVFYLTKQGELVQSAMPVPVLHVNKDEKVDTAIHLVWYPELLTFLNGQKNFNTYFIRYHQEDNPEDIKEEEVTNGTSLTLYPLEKGYTYVFQMSAAYIPQVKEHANRSKLTEEISVTLPGNLEDAVISLGKTSYKYNGSARKPSVTVKYNKRTLKKGVHYTVSYSNNTYAGTATVTVKGKGAFTGKVKKTFEIQPVWSLSGKSLSLLEGDHSTIGLSIRGFKSSTSAAAKAFRKKIVWSTSKSQVATVSGGKVTARKAGTATITVRVNGQKATCKVTVKKKDYKSLYKAFLEKGSTVIKQGNYSTTVNLRSYQILDINQDKVPELIVKATEPGSGAAFDSHYIYTIRNKKLTYLGSIVMRGTAHITYNKKYKAVQNSGWTNFVGGVWAHLFQIKGTKIVQFKYIWEGYSDMSNTTYVYYTGDTDSGQRKVSKSAYTSFVNTYFNKKDMQTIKFKLNNPQNRRKSFGS